MYAKKRNFKPLFYLLLILLLIIFCVSGYYVVDYLLESKKQGSRFDDLAAIMESMEAAEDIPETEIFPQEDSEDDTPETDTLQKKTILSRYKKLYSMNDHMVGWIKIEGTNINYPVMQTPEDRDYYLRRNFDREYSAHGCIYAREECDLESPSDNVTLYGHHMKDGSMFYDLDKYMKEDFWEAYPLIQFDTLTQRNTYEIFAVFKTTASQNQGFEYHNFIDAATEEDFDAFISTCKELALYETGITPEYGDKIICLSTCEYSQLNGRLVVAAVRTK